MKKIFSIVFFFILIYVIFNFYTHTELKNGLTIDSLNKIAVNKIDKLEGDKILKNINKIDWTKVDDKAKENILKFLEGQNLINYNGLENLIKYSKEFTGNAKELYYKILYNNYSKNPSEFIKVISDFKSEDISKILKTFTDKYIEKPKLISDLQNIIKEDKLNNQQKKRINDFVEELKNDIDK
ncbi:hypothetical protein SAMN05443428_10699 [Caloramator quimbayensis]|uniref:Uncharacterized protein n=1 Tax=Caloramator quimbayensis TaxID=1147123 RepID=A0A1T4X5R3_9CLOT|nr:hypothetical protein [Caloramator quimbayensis]SKA85010.1 hypothetical protein SAMN05443428_10699 [Caloramator quimbayensis]